MISQFMRLTKKARRIPREPLLSLAKEVEQEFLRQKLNRLADEAAAGIAALEEEK